jgi:hypothetical protein
VGFSVKHYRETAELREVTCEFGGAPAFKFWYAPQLYTPRFEQELRDDLKGEVRTRFLVTMIVHCVKRWEVLDEFPVLDEMGWPVLGEDGQPATAMQPVPLDEAHVLDLPTEFLVAIVGKLQEDQSPNAETPKPAGSFGSG